jgi:hypothetical protein
VGQALSLRRPLRPPFFVAAANLGCEPHTEAIAAGPGRWRKMKGMATVQLPNGALRRVELRGYEAHGIGKKDLKIKRYPDER